MTLIEQPFKEVKISSNYTSFLKQTFPLGFILFGLNFFINGAIHLLLIPAFMGLFLMLMGMAFYSTFSGFMDEVWDMGDYLLIKFKNKTLNIPLTDIVSISYIPGSKHDEVVILLNKESDFGRRIRFVSLSGYGKSESSIGFKELKTRIEKYYTLQDI